MPQGPFINIADEMRQNNLAYQQQQDDQLKRQLLRQQIQVGPVHNALAQAQLQQFQQQMADDQTARQAAQKESANMTAAPTAPTPDAMGNMSPGTARPNQDVQAAVINSYIRNGDVNGKGAKLLTETMKQYEATGDTEGMAQFLTKATGKPVSVAHDHKSNYLVVGKNVFDIENKKYIPEPPDLQSGPKSVDEFIARGLAANDTGMVARGTAAKQAEAQPKTGTDFTPQQQVALAAQAQKLSKSVAALTPAEQNAALTAPKDPEMEALRKAMLQIGIANAKTQLTPDTAVEQMAQSIIEGRSTPSQLSSMGRSKVRSQIMARVYELNPEYDQMSAEAGLQAGNKNQKQIRALDAVGTGLDVLEKASKEFKRTDIGLLNRIVLGGEIQVNDEKAINFQTSLQGVIDDLASALSGGGATTDQSRNQATKIFNQAYSAGGIDSAIKTVRKIIAGRRARFSSGTVYSNDSRLTQPTGGASTTAPIGPNWSAEDEARFQQLSGGKK
jgi:hypothetical protein